MWKLKKICRKNFGQTADGNIGVILENYEESSEKFCETSKQVT